MPAEGEIPAGTAIPVAAIIPAMATAASAAMAVLTGMPETEMPAGAVPVVKTPGRAAQAIAAQRVEAILAMEGELQAEMLRDMAAKAGDRKAGRQADPLKRLDHPEAPQVRQVGRPQGLRIRVPKLLPLQAGMALPVPER